ncbi:hypothetical protein ACHAWF_010114 [Thalassiosira exigua]
MGVPPEDCLAVGSLIGTKVIANEFVAFGELGQLINDGAISEKSVTIATFALCGFSNFSAMGIQCAVFGSLLPQSKKKWVPRLALSACVAGNTACFMTAAIAGLFYQQPELLDSNTNITTEP